MLTKKKVIRSDYSKKKARGSERSTPHIFSSCLLHVSKTSFHFFIYRVSTYLFFMQSGYFSAVRPSSFYFQKIWLPFLRIISKFLCRYANAIKFICIPSPPGLPPLLECIYTLAGGGGVVGTANQRLFFFRVWGVYFSY